MIVRRLATIVLAAGEGSRYGSAKQLAPIEGRPMLARVLDVVQGLGEAQVLVLGAHADRVQAELPLKGWRVVVAEDWRSGPGASLRAGLEAAGDTDEALIVLGDLPWLQRAAAQRVLDAAATAPEDAVRAFDGATPGHPLLLRRRLLQAARHAPDAGMGALLRQAAVARAPCEGLGVTRDVDVPTDAATDAPANTATETPADAATDAPADAAADAADQASG